MFNAYPGRNAACPRSSCSNKNDGPRGRPYPYEGNNFKRSHVLIFLDRITVLPSEETFAPMFERRLRTAFTKNSWRSLRTRTDKIDLLDLVSSDDNIQSRLFDVSPSSFIRGKFSEVKYTFEEAKLLFTNFYFSRKAK